MPVPKVRINTPATVSVPNHPDPMIKYVNGVGGDLYSFRITVTKILREGDSFEYQVKYLDEDRAMVVEADWFNEDLTHRRVQYEIDHHNLVKDEPFDDLFYEDKLQFVNYLGYDFLNYGNYPEVLFWWNTWRGHIFG